MENRIGIAGSGAIACGLAATAAHHGPVLLVARSTGSAERARATVEKALARHGGEIDPGRVQIGTDSGALAGATFVVEAVVEDHDVKAALLSELAGTIEESAILATTTSSLSIERLAEESGVPERFVGLHVFNPVTRMKLVELIFPAAAGADVGRLRLGPHPAVLHLRQFGFQFGDAGGGGLHQLVRRQRGVGVRRVRRLLGVGGCVVRMWIGVHVRSVRGGRGPRQVFVWPDGRKLLGRRAPGWPCSGVTIKDAFRRGRGTRSGNPAALRLGHSLLALLLDFEIHLRRRSRHRENEARRLKAGVPPHPRHDFRQTPQTELT